MTAYCNVALVFMNGIHRGVATHVLLYEISKDCFKNANAILAAMTFIPHFCAADSPSSTKVQYHANFTTLHGIHAAALSRKLAVTDVGLAGSALALLYCAMGSRSRAAGMHGAAGLQSLAGPHSSADLHLTATHPLPRQQVPRHDGTRYRRKCYSPGTQIFFARTNSAVAGRDSSVPVLEKQKIPPRDCRNQILYVACGQIPRVPRGDILLLHDGSHS